MLKINEQVFFMAALDIACDFFFASVSGIRYVELAKNRHSRWLFYI